MHTLIFDIRRGITVTSQLIISVLVLATSVQCNRTMPNGYNDSLQRLEYVKLRQKVYGELFDSYDSRIPPGFHTDEPVKVTIQLHILSIDTISETNMDFSMGMFLRQRWNDSRLSYTQIPGIKSLELDLGTMSKAWIPDLFIPNEKKAEVHQVTVPNKLMHIFPSGAIQYSQRISATLKCQFDLRTFPLDTQHCAVEMESYGYTKDTLRFQWHEDPVQIANNLLIPQFSLETITSSQCDKIYVGAGYTCVRFDFWMQRSLGYYVTQVYIPSILIVILSWVSFWLDIDAVPARISLGLLSVLTMTTQSTGVRQGLPKVSYVKGIDIWMAMCLLFVFGGLVQFAYVNVLSRVAKRRKISMPTIANMAVGIKLSPKIKEGDDEENGNSPGKSRRESSLLLVRRKLSSFLSPDREKARNVDRVCRVTFPAAFCIFNIIYWTVYTTWQPSSGI